MYYTQAGGVDLLKAKWRKLSDFLSVECDGVDITPKLKQHKVHSVLFLNVPCFGSGTRYIIPPIIGLYSHYSAILFMQALELRPGQAEAG